jgi:peptide/nickel transport system ATP-binding protein
VEAQILALLADLRQRRAVSLLFISHNLGVVRQVCDELVVMYASQAVEQGAASRVLRQPLHPYTKGLMASLPRLRPAARGARLPSIAGQMADLANPPAGCFFAPRCAFAEPRCGEARQALAVTGDRLVRCWKAGSAGAWPVAAEVPQAAPPSLTAAPLLQLAGLRKVYGGGGLGWFARRRPGVVAVDGVSLSIAPGEVFGLVGESGCGKSTLGRLALRLLAPSGGRIAFRGAALEGRGERSLRPFRRAAQIIFQNADSSLNPRLSIGAALERPLALFRRMPRAARRRRVAELLEMVRLPPGYRTRYPHQLSGGEKQRVAIARALATEPEFIVCDEPVSALDVSVQAAIVNLMADLRDRMGLAYLFISHDLAVVAQLSDRIAVMYRGGICEIGRTAEVLAAPFHPYTEALLAALPRVDGEQRPVLAAPAAESAGDAAAAGCRFRARCAHHLGAICDTEAPPLRPLSGTHGIACHRPVVPA